MFVYLNGKIVPSKDACISVFDHGFLYGDGIYETMRVYDGVVFKIDEHLSRLYRSASLIGLKIPLDTAALKIAVYETLIANTHKNAYVRLTISRGYGSVGLDPDFCPKPTIVIIAKELKEYPRDYYERGITLILAKTRRNLKKAIDPRIKSLNFLNNILAKIEAKKAGAYEALMLNAQGVLTEGTISNVFFFRDHMLCTPSVKSGILDGITRGLIIELASRDDIPVHEGRFTTRDLLTAEEVFITNTTMEAMPVSKVNDKTYKVGKIAKHIRKSYHQEVKAYIANVKNEGPSLWSSPF